MDSIEVYNRFLADLDKAEETSVDRELFNRLSTKALYEYVNNKYSEFELSGKRTDDIRVLVSNTSIDVEDSYVDLPEDYLYTLLIILNYQSEDACIGSGKKVVRKYTSDLKGYSGTNHYWKDSLSNPFYQIFGDKIKFFVGDSSDMLTKADLEYIKKPELIIINPDTGIGTETSYTDANIEEIIAIMVRMYRGDTYNPLYNISLQEDNLKND